MAEMKIGSCAHVWFEKTYDGEMDRWMTLEYIKGKV